MQACESCLAGVPRCSCDMRLVDRPGKSEPDFEVLHVDTSCPFHDLLYRLVNEHHNEEAYALISHEADHLVSEYEARKRVEARHVRQRQLRQQHINEERDHRHRRALNRTLTHRPFEALSKMKSDG